MSSLLISLYSTDNPLFVRDKYVITMGNRLYVGYAQKAKANNKTTFDTTARKY